MRELRLRDPQQQAGRQPNITWDQIKAAADAGGIAPQQAVQNMQQMAQQQAS